MGMQINDNSGANGLRRRLRQGAGAAALWTAAISFGALGAHGAGPEPEVPPAPATVIPASANAERERSSAIRLPSTESQTLGAPEIESRPLSAPVGQSRGSMTDSVRTTVVLGGVVAVILGLAMGVRVLARRHGGLMAACGAGGRSPSGVLSVLGRYPIARGQTLLLLQFDRRVLLVGQTTGRSGARLATLAEMTDADEVASVLVKSRDESGESVAQKFREIVEKMSEPASAPERAVTVVAPVERADWFERTGERRAKVGAAPHSAESVKSPRVGVQTHGAARGQKMDGAAVLKSRLEAMRTGGGR